MLNNSPLTAIASRFLGKPYVFEPLGEGEKGIYSTLPLYSFDQFDCVTFVDTVLALYYARSDLADFKKNIVSIRYENGLIDYTHRTDWFTDLEWNPRLQSLGYLTDITTSLGPTQIAETIIDKPSWYTHKILANIVRSDLSEKEKYEKLKQLRSEGWRFTPKHSNTYYLPLNAILDASTVISAKAGIEAIENNISPQVLTPHSFLDATSGAKNKSAPGSHDIKKSPLEKLPKYSIIEIIRPNWRPVNPFDKTQDYGTSLNVAHMGIAIQENQDIFFYHASSIEKKVVCLPLIEYLKSLARDARPAPVRGIHVEKISSID